MTTLIHSSMIAVMLLHSICGCGWHHAHGLETGCYSDRCLSDQGKPHAHGSAATAACSHHDLAATREHELPVSSAVKGCEPVGFPSPQESPCEEEACVYVFEKSAESTPPLVGLADFFFESRPPLKLTNHSALRSEAAPPPHAESALAACARLQVWRI